MPAPTYTQVTYTSKTIPPVDAPWLNMVDQVVNGLTNVSDPTLGAALVGYASRQATLGPTLQRKLDDLMVSVKDSPYGATGTGLTDDTAAIQAAITSNPSVYFPIGTYLISAKIVMRTDSQVFFENSKNTFIQGNHAGVIFEFPYLSMDTRVEGGYFQGAGCTAIAVANTAGPFATYLPRCHINYCHFSYDLAYGVNVAPINTHISDCTFGVSGPGGTTAGWSGTMIAINAVTTFATNYVNLNTVNRCIFKVGTLTQAGINLSAGTIFHFNYCDFEQGGKVLSANNLTGLQFRGCWWENNAATAGVMFLGVDLGHTVFDGNNILSGPEAAPYWLTWASGWNTNGVTFRNNSIGLGATTNLVFDSTTNSEGPVGDSRFIFQGNFVSGGIPSSHLTSASDYGGLNSAKAWAIINTAGSGSVIASSIPGTTITRNGVGDCNINFGIRLGTSITTICPVASGQNSLVICSPIGGLDFVRVLAFSRANPANAVEDVIQLSVTGL